MTNSRVFYTPREAAGATGTRLSLRPLISGGHEWQTSDASRREIVESRSSVVMPRFTRGIQYAVTFRIKANRLWNTGSPGQAGRRRQSKLLEKLNQQLILRRSELRFRPFRPKAPGPQSNPPLMRLCNLPGAPASTHRFEAPRHIPSVYANQNRPSRDTPDHQPAARSSPGGTQLRSADPGPDRRAGADST